MIVVSNQKSHGALLSVIGATSFWADKSTGVVCKMSVAWSVRCDVKVIRWQKRCGTWSNYSQVRETVCGVIGLFCPRLWWCVRSKAWKNDTLDFCTRLDYKLVPAAYTVSQCLERYTLTITIFSVIVKWGIKAVYTNQSWLGKEVLALSYMNNQSDFGSGSAIPFLEK